MHTEILPSYLGLFTLVAALVAILTGFGFDWRHRSHRAGKDGGTPTEDSSV